MSASSEQVAVWRAIRAYYDKNLTQIIQYYPAIGNVNYDIQFMCGHKETPVEYGAFAQIKCSGIPIVCPQFPVKKYFVDFADPLLKIGIEVDGSTFHTDYAKDAKRQGEIESEGWIIYRIEGWAANWGCGNCNFSALCEDSEDGEFNEYDLQRRCELSHISKFQAHKERCCRGTIQGIVRDHYGNGWRSRYRASRKALGINEKPVGIFSIGEILRDMIDSGEWSVQ